MRLDGWAFLFVRSICMYVPAEGATVQSNSNYFAMSSQINAASQECFEKRLAAQDSSAPAQFGINRSNEDRVENNMHRRYSGSN